MSRLEGKIVALTGAAGGIGSLLVSRLIGKGATVIGIDRVFSPFCNESLVTDLADNAALDTLAKTLADRRIDILINVAGVQYFGPIEQQGAAAIRLSHAINLTAPTVLAGAVLPQMVARGAGQVVNIGSMMGAVPYPYFTVYSSAKAGLKAFSQALRRETAGQGIDVTHVSPRAVRTPLNTPAIQRFMTATKMTADEPDLVASRIIQAIQSRERDVSIGLAERLFSQINSALPQVIDRGLAGQVTKARTLFATPPYQELS